MWDKADGAIAGIPGIVLDIFSRFYSWITILALLGLFRRYLNYKNNITEYFSKSSFAVYFFHQTWIIVFAYYTFMFTDNPLIQMLVILITSVIATFVSYELCKRTSITRFIFGIRK